MAFGSSDPSVATIRQPAHRSTPSSFAMAKDEQFLHLTFAFTVIPPFSTKVAFHVQLIIGWFGINFRKNRRPCEKNVAVDYRLAPF